MKNMLQLPNATLVLILGIISIFTSICAGIPGIISGLAALTLYNKTKELYDSNPELYLGYSNLKLGKALAIIGTVLGLSFFLFLVLISILDSN